MSVIDLFLSTSIVPVRSQWHCLCYVQIRQLRILYLLEQWQHIAATDCCSCYSGTAWAVSTSAFTKPHASQGDPKALSLRQEGEPALQLKKDGCCIDVMTSYTTGQVKLQEAYRYTYMFTLKIIHVKTFCIQHQDSTIFKTYSSSLGRQSNLAYTNDMQIHKKEKPHAYPVIHPPGKTVRLPYAHGSQATAG